MTKLQTMLLFMEGVIGKFKWEIFFKNLQIESHLAFSFLAYKENAWDL